MRGKVLNFALSFSGNRCEYGINAVGNKLPACQNSEGNTLDINMKEGQPACPVMTRQVENTPYSPALYSQACGFIAARPRGVA